MNHAREVDLLIFDLDGTLIDSKKDIVMNVNRALAKAGRATFPEDVVGACIGRGIHNLFRDLIGNGPTDAEIENLILEFRAFYRFHMFDNTVVYPGIVEVLEHFRDKPKVVATNKGQFLADLLVDRIGLRPYFVGVFGPEAFSAPKPNPAPILGICEKWSVPPHRAVLVGDSVVDMEAGRTAGTATLLVRYGYGNPESIRPFAPDFSVGDAKEIMECLR